MPVLIQELEERLAPAAVEDLAASLTQTMALLGTRMSETQMAEYIGAAMIELEQIPAKLALEGLAVVRQTISDERAVIAGVFRYAEDYPAQDRKRLRRLQTLRASIEALA